MVTVVVVAPTVVLQGFDVASPKMERGPFSDIEDTRRGTTPPTTCDLDIECAYFYIRFDELGCDFSGKRRDPKIRWRYLEQSPVVIVPSLGVRLLRDPACVGHLGHPR